MRVYLLVVFSGQFDRVNTGSQVVYLPTGYVFRRFGSVGFDGKAQMVPLRCHDPVLTDLDLVEAAPVTTDPINGSLGLVALGLQFLFVRGETRAFLDASVPLVFQALPACRADVSIV